MAKLVAEPIWVGIGAGGPNNNAPFNPKWTTTTYTSRRHCTLHYPTLSSTIRASQPMDDKSKLYKELGMFSLRKKIEDSVIRAEMLAAPALEHEEARHFKQEEMVREYDLWDDLAKSNEVLANLADSAKVVDSLRDLTYKAEEAKLIAELAEMDAINCGLFEQAYTASVDVNKLMYNYETSKLLNGPYDFEGACIVIEAGSEGIYSEIWAEQLVEMYMKWAGKQCYGGRIVERYPSKNGGIKSATIEFEHKYAYGYLSGERGTHRMIRSSQNGSNVLEASLAAVDVIPLFLETSPDLIINDNDLAISFLSLCEEGMGRTKPAVHIQHIPTGLRVYSSGERSNFANKIKALNRLKAKLLVILTDQGASRVTSIKRNTIVDMWHQETRRYVFSPHKLVQDVKTGIQLSDPNSVLEGNIEPLIGASINIRQPFDTV
ncbi:hypothetical protein LguiA_024521 [Lonicera macranthoides]